MANVNLVRVQIVRNVIIVPAYSTSLQQNSSDSKLIISLYQLYVILVVINAQRITLNPVSIVWKDTPKLLTLSVFPVAQIAEHVKVVHLIHVSLAIAQLT